MRLYILFLSLIPWMIVELTAFNYTAEEEAVLSTFTTQPPRYENGTTEDIDFYVNYTSIFLDSVDFDAVVLTVQYTLVTSEGWVSASRELSIRVKCKISYARFPVDSHACRMCLATTSETGRIKMHLLDVEETFLQDNTEYTFESHLILSKQDQYYQVGICFSEAITTLKFRRVPTVSLLTTFIPNVVTFFMISLALACQSPEFDTSLNGITAFAASNQAITSQFSRSGRLPGLALVNTGLQLGSAAEAVVVVVRRKMKEARKKREAERKDKDSRAKYCLRKRRWWAKNGDTVEMVIAGLICLAIPTCLSLFVWASTEDEALH